MWPLVFLVLVVVAIVFIVMAKSKPAPPSRESKMVGLNLEPGSSFEQKTNHFQMSPVDMGPISGTESPFRVNLYKAYIE
jgi:flagellar basal body-associated protein FliL